MLTNDFAEQAAGVDGLETAVEPYGGSDVAVAQEPSNGFVITGVVPQVDGGGRMAELMDGDPQTSRLLDPCCDLDPEQMRVLGPAGGPWEKPISIRSTKQGRAILLNIFVDQRGEVVVELKGQVDAVRRACAPLRDKTRSRSRFAPPLSA